MGIKQIKIILSFLLCFAFQNLVLAQDGGGPPKSEQSLKSKRKQRKADKKEWKEERRNKRAEEKKIKNHHKRIQTKEVRKRMKRSKQKAGVNRDHTREPFFQRLFHRSGKGKHAKRLKEKTAKPQN
jgi:hypothetical protein